MRVRTIRKSVLTLLDGDLHINVIYVVVQRLRLENLGRTRHFFMKRKTVIVEVYRCSCDYEFDIRGEWFPITALAYRATEQIFPRLSG